MEPERTWSVASLHTGLASVSCELHFGMGCQRSADSQHNERGQRESKGDRQHTGGIEAAALLQHAEERRSEETADIAKGTKKSDAAGCRITTQERRRQT